MNTGKLTIHDFILIGQGYNARTVRIGDISTITVDGNLLTVCMNGLEPLTIYGTLAHCKKRLPASFFIVGRNCMVNLAEVAKVNMVTRNFVLTMKDGTVIPVSRNQSRALRKDLAL
jgi:DNA-binding LytR/AlgR family response regulator